MTERRKLGASPPGSLPSLARPDALGFWIPLGGVFHPHVSDPPARSARREPAPAPGEAAKDRGLEEHAGRRQ